jgi:RHS repeat-associated protein
MVIDVSIFLLSLYPASYVLQPKYEWSKNCNRFVGEQQDPETGLIYLRARYYEPETGRFLNRDPHPGGRIRHRAKTFISTVKMIQLIG